MEPENDKPQPEQPPREKTTAPREMSTGFSAREAARLWGTWSDGRPFDGQRRRFEYSIMY
jgi:hypothetical protein